MSAKSNYERSNAITAVHFAVNEEARRLTDALMRLATAGERQVLAEALLDELGDCAGIDICRVKISDTRQYHRRHNGRVVFKQYGYYRPQTNYPPPSASNGLRRAGPPTLKLRRAGIYIQNRTAVRAQPLAPKTFLDTLLHEWMHHYDTRKLLLASIHTAGFYQRLRLLKIQLGIPIASRA